MRVEKYLSENNLDIKVHRGWQHRWMYLLCEKDSGKFIKKINFSDLKYEVWQFCVKLGMKEAWLKQELDEYLKNKAVVICYWKDIYFQSIREKSLISEINPGTPLVDFFIKCVRNLYTESEDFSKIPVSIAKSSLCPLDLWPLQTGQNDCLYKYKGKFSLNYKTDTYNPADVNLIVGITDVLLMEKRGLFVPGKFVNPFTKFVGIVNHSQSAAARAKIRENPLYDVFDITKEPDIFYNHNKPDDSKRFWNTIHYYAVQKIPETCI